MTIVRDIFQLQFGKAKEAISLLKQGQEVLKGAGYPVELIPRIMSSSTPR
jgi:hypothetical protein